MNHDIMVMPSSELNHDYILRIKMSSQSALQNESSVGISPIPLNNLWKVEHSLTSPILSLMGLLNGVGDNAPSAWKKSKNVCLKSVEIKLRHWLDQTTARSMQVAKRDSGDKLNAGRMFWEALIYI